MFPSKPDPVVHHPYQILMMLFEKRSRPVRIRPPKERITPPPLEVEIYRVGDFGGWEVWVHLRSEDCHDFGFDLRVCEGFYPVREIALRDGFSGDKSMVMHERRTVTVTKRTPDPGK